MRWILACLSLLLLGGLGLKVYSHYQLSSGEMSSLSISSGEMSRNPIKDKSSGNIEREHKDFQRKSKHAYHGPVVAASIIIRVYKQGNFKGFLLIDRCNPPYGKALPGGFVEYGESIEQAALRELGAECGIYNVPIDLLEQFRVYSNPNRDARFHIIDTVQTVRVDDKTPQAGTDAAQVYVYAEKDIPWESMAFDHAQILKDFLQSPLWKTSKEISKGEEVSKESALTRSNSVQH